MEQQLKVKPVQRTPGLSIRAPSSSDLQPWSYSYIPAQKESANLLIMFHGLGDTKESFATLAKSMNWPHTACISLQAPFPVPLMPDSWMWYNPFDPMMMPLPSPDPTPAIPKLRELLETLNGLGWPLSRIHLFGWQQGASMALELARSVAGQAVAGYSRLGSVVSVCGKWEREPSGQLETPILWFSRSRSESAVGKKEEALLRKVVESDNYEIVRGKPGDSEMIKGMEEWGHVFKWWGKVMAKPDEGWKGDGEVYEVVGH